MKKRPNMSNEAIRLATRRTEILACIEDIQSMRKGVLNTTYKKVAHKNGEVVSKGPYYILSWKGPGNKTESEAIAAKDAPHVQKEVDNYKQFRRLTEEYIEVCEQLSLLKEAGDDTKKN
jgi:hypothetical protein